MMYTKAKIYKSLREHAMNIINFWKKMKLLTKEYQESYENVKICYICKENLKANMGKLKIIKKLDIIAIIQMNIVVLHTAYAI